MALWVHCFLKHTHWLLFTVCFLSTVLESNGPLALEKVYTHGHGLHPGIKQKHDRRFLGKDNFPFWNFCFHPFPFKSAIYTFTNGRWKGTGFWTADRPSRARSGRQGAWDKSGLSLDILPLSTSAAQVLFEWDETNDGNEWHRWLRKRGP